MSAFGLTHGLLDLSLLRVVEKNFQRVWGKQKARNVKVNDDFDFSKVWFGKQHGINKSLPQQKFLSVEGGAWNRKQLSDGGEYCEWRETTLKKAALRSNSKEEKTIVAPPEFIPALNTEIW